ncbi:MAG: lipocalin family protein [Geobacteraceae bacterium]|nr:lipocalin family protein [Geobacteraceae bacterium]
MKHTILTIALLFVTGCSASLPPLKTIDNVDIKRFMGPWYVIACIPTFIETEAYNGIETYRLDPDGSIDTVFTFNKGGFDGPSKRYNPRGFIVDRVNNSTWGMQFIWPLKSEFLITHLNADYSQTVIGRNKRDYVWIMARTPQIPEADYLGLVKELEGQGYDISKLRKVPQRWPDGGIRP